MKAAENVSEDIPAISENNPDFQVASSHITPTNPTETASKAESKIKKSKIYPWKMLQALALLLLALFEIRTNTGYNIVVCVAQLFARFSDASENREE